MANAPIYISDAYIQAGEEETAFGTESAAITVPFGVGQLVSRTARNNFHKVRGLGSRNITQSIPGRFEGTASLNWTVANGYWLKPLLGAVADTGSAPYLHTYSEANTLPSMTIEAGMNLDTDSVIKLLGCTMDSVTLKCEQGAPVTAEASISYITESEGTSLDGAPATDSETPFSFAQATLEIPNATGLSDIQSVNLTIANNTQLVAGLGSRHPTHAVPLARDYTFNVAVPYESASIFLEKFYGSGTGPNSTVASTTFDLILSNGLASSSTRSIQITLAGVYFDEQSINADSADDLVREGITAYAQSLTTAVYSNNTATDPW